MEYTAKPVWTFWPNWDDGILERLEWLTDVLASGTGVEQRISRRLTPRRSFETSYLLAGDNRRYFDNVLASAGATSFLYPLHHDVAKTTAPAAAGSSFIAMDTRFREFVNGGYGIVRAGGMDSMVYEVVDIQTVTDTGLQLTSNLVKDWPAGSRIYPARSAVIDGDPSVTKQTDDFVSMNLRFLINEANPYESGSVPVAYNGVPILDMRPDESEDLTHTYTRLLETLDNTTGIPRRFDLAGVQFATQQYRWAVIGIENNALLRRTLYRMRGKAEAIWLPTFMQDFTLAQPVNLGDTMIRVKNVGFTRTGALGPGRQYIRIEALGGKVVYRRIVASTEMEDGTEIIGVDEEFETQFFPNEMIAISFMGIARLDTDSIEINHDTDVQGLTRITASFRTTPAMRHAEDWTPYPFPDRFKNAAEAFCSCQCSDFTTVGMSDGSKQSLPAAGDGAAAWQLFYRNFHWDSAPGVTADALDALIAELSDPAHPELQDVRRTYMQQAMGVDTTSAEQTAQLPDFGWVYKDAVGGWGNTPNNAYGGDLVTRFPQFAESLVRNFFFDQTSGHVNPPIQGDIPDADYDTYFAEFCLQVWQGFAESHHPAMLDRATQWNGGAAAMYARYMNTYGAAAVSDATWPSLAVPGTDPTAAVLRFGNAAQITFQRAATQIAADTIRPRSGAIPLFFMEAMESIQTGDIYSPDATNPGAQANFTEQWIRILSGGFISKQPFPKNVTVELRNTLPQTVIRTIDAETRSVAMPDGRYYVLLAYAHNLSYTHDGYGPNPSYNGFKWLDMPGKTIIVRITKQ